MNVIRIVEFNAGRSGVSFFVLWGIGLPSLA